MDESRSIVKVVRWRFGLPVLLSVVCGVFLTWVSGFCGRDVSGRLGLSVVGYGLPLSWHTTSWVVSPMSPVISSYSWQSFVVDTTFWAIITGIAILAILSIKPRKARNLAVNPLKDLFLNHE